LGFGEERGMQVVYGDTDSGMYGNTTREEFAAFVKACNVDLFPRIVASTGADRNHIKFDYEKAFKRIVFVKGNNGKPAKKRYVGTYSFYKGVDATADSKPEIKGLEWKRGDTNLMARLLQWDVVQLFHKGLDVRSAYEAVAVEWKRHVLDDALTVEEVKEAKSLGKPIDDYVVKTKKDGSDSAKPAHVRVAEMLRDRGSEAEEGTRIDYYMKDHPTRTVLPAEDYRDDADRYYLWESKVYPPSQRLLEAIFPEPVGGWKELKKARPKKPRGGRSQVSEPLVAAASSDRPPRRKRVAEGGITPQA
jgi:DNA polymerase elongation subunit (family B)